MRQEMEVIGVQEDIYHKRKGKEGDEHEQQCEDTQMWPPTLHELW